MPNLRGASPVGRDERTCSTRHGRATVVILGDGVVIPRKSSLQVTREMRVVLAGCGSPAHQ